MNANSYVSKSDFLNFTFPSCEWNVLKYMEKISVNCVIRRDKDKIRRKRERKESRYLVLD